MGKFTKKSPMAKSQIAGADELRNTHKVTIYRTFKFRLYPNKHQMVRLIFILEICRWLYNSALQQRRDTYKMWQRHQRGPKPQINRFTQSKELTNLKAEIPELLQIFDKILRDVLGRVDKTFDAFFRRVKAGQKPGYPRYKSLNRYDSFTYTGAALEGSDGLDKAPGWSIKNNKLMLSMGRLAEPIGPIKIKLHRTLVGRVRTLTIVRTSSGEWYACFSVSQEVTIPTTNNDTQEPTNVVGVALGVQSLLTLSTGETIENPRFFQHSEAQLAKAQQVVANKVTHKKKNKNIVETKDNYRNLKKARRAVAKIHRRIANQRHDYLHKVSRGLVDRFSALILPDFDIMGLTGRLHLY